MTTVAWVHKVTARLLDSERGAYLPVRAWGRMLGRPVWRYVAETCGRLHARDHGHRHSYAQEKTSAGQDRPVDARPSGSSARHRGLWGTA